MSNEPLTESQREKFFKKAYLQIRHQPDLVKSGKEQEKEFHEMLRDEFEGKDITVETIRKSFKDEKIADTCTLHLLMEHAYFDAKLESIPQKNARPGGNSRSGR